MIRKKPLSMDLVILGLRRVGIPAPCLSPSLQWALPLQQVTLRSVCWLRGNLYCTVGNLGRAGWNKQKRGNVTFETTLPLKLWVSCCVRDLSEKRNEQKWIVLGANCVRSKLSLNYFKNHESCKSQFSKTSEKCNILHLLTEAVFSCLLRGPAYRGREDRATNAVKHFSVSRFKFSVWQKASFGFLFTFVQYKNGHQAVVISSTTTLCIFGQL